MTLAINSASPSWVLFASAAKHTLEEGMREERRARTAVDYWLAQYHTARAVRLREASRDHLRAAREAWTRAAQ